MHLRNVWLGLVLGLLFSAQVVAQPAGSTKRVAVLTPSQSGESTIRQITLPALAKLGFHEGRDYTYQVFSANDQAERLPALALDLVAMKPDVIIAVGPSSIRAARAATTTIPVVMSFGGEDPIAAGWAESYARPGKNITGVVMLSPELDGKRSHVLFEAFPQARRVAVLFNELALRVPDDRFTKHVERAARSSGVDVVKFFARGAADYEGVFAQIAAARPDALQIGSSTVFTNDIPRLAELAIRAKLPTICDWPDSAQKGCLLGYGPDRADLRKRTADYIARLFRGGSASEMPIEDPSKFELAVNMNTARALGIEVPPSVLAQADTVIE